MCDKTQDKHKPKSNSVHGKIQVFLGGEMFSNRLGSDTHQAILNSLLLQHFTTIFLSLSFPPFTQIWPKLFPPFMERESFLSEWKESLVTCTSLVLAGLWAFESCSGNLFKCCVPSISLPEAYRPVNTTSRERYQNRNQMLATHLELKILAINKFSSYSCCIC